MQKIMTYETLRRFAYSNDHLIEGEIRGIMVQCFGLNFLKMYNEDPADSIEYAQMGILHVIPYYNPWCWMNEQTVAYIDEIIAVLCDHYALGDDVKIVVYGSSMGGLCALTYCAYAAKTPCACAVNCPVCDLPYHFTEREDLPRTLYSAMWHYNGTLEEALLASSPMHLVDRMPDIPYTIFHCERDKAVNIEMHSVRFVEAMRRTNHDVTLIRVPLRGHGDLSAEYWLRFRQTILNAFL